MRYVVGYALEDSAGFLAAGAGAVEAEFGTDLHDGLLADGFARGKFTDDTGNVFFLDGTILDLHAHFLGSSGVLADEHNAAGEPIESIAGQWVPVIAPFGTHDLDNRVIVVTTGGMNRYSGGLVDDNHIIILVDYSNRFGGDRGLMPVEGVGDDVSVFDEGLRGRDNLTIDDDLSSFYSVFLKRISSSCWAAVWVVDLLT